MLRCLADVALRFTASAPRDDIVSLAYLLAYLLLGHLPWSRSASEADLIQKKRVGVVQLIDELPGAFRLGTFACH